MVTLVLLASAMLGACSSAGMMNSMSSDVGFQLTESVPFDAATGLTADVYRPIAARNAPVVVYFYGGRWSFGDKSDFKFVGQALASRGYVVVIPNVRLYPQARFPDFVNDGARAVRWAKDNIGAYGGDRNNLFVMGHSSGAHIAAMLALDPQYMKAVGLQRPDLRGMIGLAGPYDFLPITAPDLRDIFGPPDRFPYTQPIYYTDGRNPPLLLMHGRNDETVPVSNTEKLARDVAKNGGAVDTVIYERLSHSMIIGSLASYMRGRADVLDEIEVFINRVIKQPQQPRESSSDNGLNPNVVEGIEGLALPPDPADQRFDLQPLEMSPIEVDDGGLSDDPASAQDAGSFANPTPSVYDEPVLQPTPPPTSLPSTVPPLPPGQ